MRTATFLLALAATGTAGDEPKPPKPPEPVVLAFTGFANKADSVKAEAADDRVTLRVKSERGFGHFTATPDAGAWPRQVTVLFEGLNELEQFDASAGRLRIVGSRKTSGKFAVHFADADGKWTPGRSVGTLDFRVEQRKDGILVTFPPDLVAGKEPLFVGWTDWYRR